MSGEGLVVPCHRSKCMFCMVERAGKGVRCATLREAERCYRDMGCDGLHKPCEYRKHETRDGVELDWCYAIGFERVGDMPCEYCADAKGEGADEN